MPAAEAWSLYISVALFGFVYGGLSVAESPLVAELFGLSSHGLIYGNLVFAWTLGASIGPFLSGYIFDVTVSYQIAFSACAVTGIVSLVSTALLRPLRKGKVKA